MVKYWRMWKKEWKTIIEQKRGKEGKENIRANDWFGSLPNHPISTLGYSLSAWNQLDFFSFLSNLIFSAIIEVNAFFIYNDSYSGWFKKNKSQHHVSADDKQTAIKKLLRKVFITFKIRGEQGAFTRVILVSNNPKFYTDKFFIYIYPCPILLWTWSKLSLFKTRIQKITK